MPERFHYSKPTYRLGEITVLPDLEGQILSAVNLCISLIKQYVLFICRIHPIHLTLIKVITDG